MVSVRPGECACLVAEKLAFHQVFGNRGTVDRNQRAVGTRTAAMDCPSDQLFARAAFATQQHAPRRGTHTVDLVFEFLHHSALADQLGIAGRRIEQSLEIAPQANARPGTHQGDHRQVGHRNNKVEIGLPKTAIL